MSRLRNLTVGINFKTDLSRLKDLDSKINKTINSLDKMGQSMEKVGKWGMLRITAPLTALGGMMINTASNAQEMRGMFSVVFQEMENDVRNWAESTSRAIGRSQLDLEGYLASTQNTLVGMGLARDVAADFSKEIVQMGVDLASFNNLADDDAIRSLQSVLVGNHNAAQALNATINENTLALAMQEMGIKGTFRELDETRKMQVRFRAITMQSEDAIGDAARTSESFKNQMKALWGAIKDISGAFGDELLPAATWLVGRVRGLVDGFRDLSSSQRRFIVIIGAVVAGVFPLLFIFGKLFQALKFVKLIALPALKPFLWFALKAAVLFFVIEDLITAFFGLGDSITESLFDGLMSFLGFEYTFQQFRDDIINSLVKVGEFFTGIWNSIKNAWGQGEGWLADLVYGMGTMFAGWLNYLANLFKVGFGIIWGIFTGDWKILEEGWQGMIDAGFQIWDGIKQMVSKPLDWAAGKFEEWKNWGLQKVDELVQGFLNVPDRIMEGFRNLGGRMKESVSGALQSVRNLLPFSPVKDKSSPLADLYKAGQNIIGNIQEGMAQASISADFHGPVGASAAPVMGGGGFSPTVNVTVNAGSGDAQEIADTAASETEFALERFMDKYFDRAAKRNPVNNER